MHRGMKKCIFYVDIVTILGHCEAITTSDQKKILKMGRKAKNYPKFFAFCIP